MSADQTLADLRDEIDTRLADYFASAENFDVPLSDHGRQAFELLAEFSQRPGKRLRGALAMLSYHMFGGTNRQVALDLALAVELIQAYLLIVDDIMDRSLSRRGRPTVHRLYLDLLPKTGGTQQDHEHLSNMLALNVGLIAQHAASRILADVPEEASRVVKAHSLFHANIAVTGFGQIDDLFNDMTSQASEEAIRHTYQLKSSYYTFINPLQTGAALAGASDADQAACHAFGLHAGLAFQLQDDIIGMFGDEKATGKSPLDDLREGKLTLLMEYALKHAQEDEVRQLRDALGNTTLSVEQHQAVQAIVRDTGSLQYVQDMAATETAKAVEVLRAQASWNASHVELLEQLLLQLTERKV